MRAFHYFMWLSGFGLLHSACAPVVNLAESGDGGGESGTVAEGGGTGTCSSNADCGATEICGFLESQTCSATGKCFTAPEATCMAYAAGCACDGSEINIACNGLPSGYETKPLRYVGACTDASPPSEAGPSDSGPAHCATDSDCPSGEHCGYPISLACSAQGQCMQAPTGATGYCGVEALSCGCNGTDIMVPACPVGLPAGYTSVPSAHAGSCTDATSPPPVDAGRTDASPPPDSGGNDAGVTPCVTDSDCPANARCGYGDWSRLSDCVGGDGLCFPASEAQLCGPGEGTYGVGCACDGTEILLTCNGLPAGEVSKPLSHTGSCTDASPPVDSGGSDAAPKPCVTDSDCGANGLCGYLMSAACSAQGQCFVMAGICSPPAPGPSYLCACDGSDMFSGCAAGLPSDYASKPFLHTGPCTDASPPADSGGSDAVSTPCVTDSDCGANGVCGFLDTLACSAQGQCFPAPGALCASYLPGCACDGTEINIACTGMPTGYVSKPLLHSGVCTDASPPAEGGVDAGGAPCVTSANCGANEICGFPESEACSAQGTCFQSAGATCMAYSAGCACDGTIINIVCNGLPGGYETKPLRHTGMCTGDGG
jgi:hypothetical protein